MQQEKSSVGQRIRFLRQLLGFSQQDLANVFGVKNYNTVVRYENGTIGVSEDKLAILAARGLTTIKWLKTGIIEKDICHNLAQIRIKHKYTLEKFSELIGVPVQIVSAIENCQMAPSPHYLHLITCSLPDTKNTMPGLYGYKNETLGIEVDFYMEPEELWEVVKKHPERQSAMVRLLQADERTYDLVNMILEKYVDLGLP